MSHEEKNEDWEKCNKDKNEKEDFNGFTGTQGFDKKRCQTYTNLNNNNLEILQKLKPSDKNTLLLERLKNFSLNNLNNHNKSSGNSKTDNYNNIKQSQKACSLQILDDPNNFNKHNKQTDLINENANLKLNENFYLNTSTCNNDFILNNPLNDSTGSLYLANDNSNSRKNNNNNCTKKAQKFTSSKNINRVLNQSTCVKNNNKPLINKTENVYGNSNNIICTSVSNNDFTELICKTENNIITLNAQDEVFKKIYRHSRANSKGSYNSITNNNKNIPLKNSFSNSFRNANKSKNNGNSNFGFYKNKQKNHNLNFNFLNDSENNYTENNIRTSCGGASLNTKTNTSLNLAWINILKKSNAELNSKQESDNVIAENSDFLGVNASHIQNENSVFSENFNFEDFNKILSEDKLNNLINENSFSNSESHSTLPFFLLFSREIHRMCISDYEIKLLCKKFKFKLKTDRLEWIDFYKKGIIKVFQAKYFEAFNYFKEAESRKKEEIEVKKWISFVLILIIFCADLRKSQEKYNLILAFNEKKNKSDIKDNDNKNGKESEIRNNLNGECNYFDSNFYASFFMNSFKIDLENLRNVEIKNEEIDYSVITEARDSDDEIDDEADAAFFACCNSRKPETKRRRKRSNVSNSLVDSSSKFNKYLLAKELEINLKHLSDPEVLSRAKANYEVEINWMYLIISIFVKMNPNQRVFTFISDPRFYIRKIRDKDPYLGYLAYAQYNVIVNEDFNPEKILVEIIDKYPKRIEGFLYYWGYLTKSKNKDYSKALILSQIFFKNLAQYQFEHDIYYLYMINMNAKSYYYLNNVLFTITSYQKEYPTNFMNPSIYFMFAKYSSKTDIDNLNLVSISSLGQVKKLLYEDLYFSSLYLIGGMYFNLGLYDKCFKNWICYYQNINNSFCPSIEKMLKVKSFLTEYYSICNSVLKFKKNLFYFKNYQPNSATNPNNSTALNYINISYPNANNNKIFESNLNNFNNANNNLTGHAKFSSSIVNDFDSESQSDLKNFFEDFETLYKYKPNLTANYTENYEYYRALIHMYINKNNALALNIFTNIITRNQYFFPAYSAIWKMIRKSEPHRKLLLSFSYFLIKITQSEENKLNKWIQACILYSKALFYDNQLENALAVLRSLIDLFPCFPIDNLKYIEEINKSNKISLKNNFLKYDLMSDFYSRFHVYQKCEKIFEQNFNLDKPTDNDLELYDFPYLIASQFDNNSNYKADSAGYEVIDKEKNLLIENLNLNESNDNISPKANVNISNNSILNNSKEKMKADLTSKTIKDSDGKVKRSRQKILSENEENFSSNQNNIESNCHINYKETLKIENSGNNHHVNFYSIANNELEEIKEDEKFEKEGSSIYNGNSSLRNTEANQRKENRTNQNNSTAKQVSYFEKTYENSIEKQNNIDFEDNFSPMKNYKIDDGIDCLKDYKIDDFEKLKKFLNTRIDRVKIDTESAFISISTNIQPLYQMGKLCAKANHKLEMGLLCLNDYIAVLKFQNNYDPNPKMKLQKSMAIFFKGVIYCLLKQYNSAHESLKHKWLIENLEKKPKRIKFKALFFEFYRKFKDNEAQNFYFDSNDLRNL